MLDLCMFDYRHLLDDIGVAVVEIRLLFEKLVEVALPSHWVICPGGVSKHTHLTKNQAL